MLSAFKVGMPLGCDQWLLLISRMPSEAEEWALPWTQNTYQKYLEAISS